jgi:hypothetical protein
MGGRSIRPRICLVLDDARRARPMVGRLSVVYGRMSLIKGGHHG